jgi:hypothetical protein
MENRRSDEEAQAIAAIADAKKDAEERRKPTDPLSNRHIVATLRQVFGKRYADFEKLMETAPQPAIYDFMRLLRDMESEIHNAKRNGVRDALMGKR